MISLLGIPLDENSSFQRGAAKAPQKIIEAFYSESTNDHSENGINSRSSAKVKVIDPLVLPSGKSAIEKIYNVVYNELEKGNNIISIGGDHSITFPIIQAYAKKYDSLNILHFDAHPDLYDNFDENHSSSLACLYLLNNKVA